MRQMLVLALILFLCFAGLAQEQSGSVRSLVHSDRALLFEFNGLDLRSFQGGIGCKRWISPSLALLPVVKLAYSDQKNPNLDYQSTYDETLEKDYNFGLDVSLARYFRPQEKIAPFLIGGVGSFYWKSESEGRNNGETISKSEQKS